MESIEKLLGQPKNAESDWVTAVEARTILGVGETTLWSMRREGKLKANRIRRKLYFRRKDIEELIESNQL